MGSQKAFSGRFLTGHKAAATEADAIIFFEGNHAFLVRLQICIIPCGAVPLFASLLRRLDMPTLRFALLVAVCCLQSAAVAQQTYEFGVSYPTADSFHPPERQPSEGCGRFEFDPRGIGPVDFRKISPYTIVFVEVRHFDRGVETLKRGIKSSVAGDIAYTLRAFPNHPRALRSVAALVRRNGGVTPPDLGLSVACWFDRAVAYRPDDIDVRIVFATELLRDGRAVEAREHIHKAEELVSSGAQDNARFHYNVALLLYEIKEYEKSLQHAKKAYELGFELPGLRNKLKGSGHWRDDQ